MTVTATTEDSGLPVMLDSKDVVDAFKRYNLAIYAEARREFYHEVNLNPFRPHAESTLRFVEWMFWDWFSYDCAISGHGLSLDESEDLELELEHRPGMGISPFIAMGELLYEHTDKIDNRGICDLRDIDETNFASMFWIRDANAASGCLRLEDIVQGGTYDVMDHAAAGKYDGARGGMIVNRIAYARGAWRTCAIPVYEARRPDDPEVGGKLIRDFRNCGYRPDFPGLVRFFYGRAKDTGLDWEQTDRALREGTLDGLIRKACER
ncbi:hypothetical protein [Bifidobacterium scaligerum]|uniref:Uncharacterized protein n=1 Tax=Bifidobacterium scaligerum TaxID=2052656 RepID=A0A2M9HRC8_9BIFI|nr:hypothetical protein [Bifidobacterium scaligerum]PJM79375.1 hypothetical protein CUU80_04945 [Bifidobacterium scaligerum]